VKSGKEKRASLRGAKRRSNPEAKLNEVNPVLYPFFCLDCFGLRPRNDVLLFLLGKYKGLPLLSTFNF
jgi:hypothetical protein